MSAAYFTPWPSAGTLTFRKERAQDARRALARYRSIAGSRPSSSALDALADACGILGQLVAQETAYRGEGSTRAVEALTHAAAALTTARATVYAWEQNRASA